ncbi:MAG TPA: HPr(Ser) kinase/phosphatase [Rhodocyclaceae bacterium]|nr:HPr(Ser) kinase/phosphatase [Rhodocyclaceae bacterium]
MRQLRVAQLFERNRNRLQLACVCGELERAIEVTQDDMSPSDLVGHLNLIHPERIQIVGTPELNWAQRLPSEQAQQHIQDIIDAKPPAIIVADGCDLPVTIDQACRISDTPLFTSPQSSAHVIDTLRSYVSRELAETVSMHGVLMDVFGIGVLITGDSGVGKSELALELISRGHGLVADDVAEISRVAPNILEGRCPDMLRDFLEVRGLGLLNIRTIFGETASRRKMRLKLIVHLQRMQVNEMTALERLPTEQQMIGVLGVEIRRVVLPVAAGRNLAVLIEGAVRSTILLLRGIDSTQEFIHRQQTALYGSDDFDE